MPRYVSGGNVLINPVKLLKKAGVGAGMKVGDFGAGAAGHFSIPAAQMVGSKGEVYSVDILKPVLESIDSKARFEGIYNIKTVWSNLETYGAAPIEDNAIDVGLIVNVLFQAEKDDDIIRECARMIKPDGKMLVVDWTKTAGAFGPDPDRRVNPAAVKKAAEQSGMQALEEFEAGPYHFALLFQKKAAKQEGKDA